MDGREKKRPGTACPKGISRPHQKYTERHSTIYHISYIVYHISYAIYHIQYNTPS
jgi:hypothetical protein